MTALAVKLSALRACGPGVAWVEAREAQGPAVGAPGRLWLDCERGEWMLWALDALDVDVPSSWVVRELIVPAVRLVARPGPLSGAGDGALMRMAADLRRRGVLGLEDAWDELTLSDRPGAGAIADAIAPHVLWTGGEGAGAQPDPDPVLVAETYAHVCGCLSGLDQAYSDAYERGRRLTARIVRKRWPYLPEVALRRLDDLFDPGA